MSLQKIYTNLFMDLWRAEKMGIISENNSIRQAFAVVLITAD